MRLCAANELDHDALTDLWNRGYAGYFFPLHFTASMLQSWIRSCDIDLSISRVALDPNPVGLILVGRRGDRGWVGGFGVASARRNEGIGKALAAAAVDAARAAGLRRLKLEALSENGPALRAYESAGFKVVRSFGIHRGRIDVDLPSGGEEIPLSELLPALADLHPGALQPCWQREDKTLAQASGDVRALVAGFGPDASLVYRLEHQNLTLLDLGLRTDAARPELLSLFASLQKRHPGVPATLLNEPSQAPIAPLLPDLGLPRIARQFEMQESLA